ncbi:MAG TPA: tetratricopeptide repeat protein [Nitrospiria bacterium]|jgi:Flp pilus assembly protein TadD
MKKIVGYGMLALFAGLFLGLAVETVEAGSEKALSASRGSAGEAPNAEGIKHYNKDHWGVAEEHFREAVKADEKLAEAHFNLALSLDKLGNHGEATQHFKKALELAPKNPAIADSKILKAHLGM